MVQRIVREKCPTENSETFSELLKMQMLKMTLKTYLNSRRGLFKYIKWSNILSKIIIQYSLRVLLL